MDVAFFTDERWAELHRTIEFFDADELDRVLISMLEDLSEHFDGENEFLVFSLEKEIGRLKYRNEKTFFCCKNQKIDASNKVSTNFSDFLIDIARAKNFDQQNSGFIEENFLRQIVGERIEPTKLDRLLRNSTKNREGKMNFFDFFLDLIETSI